VEKQAIYNLLIKNLQETVPAVKGKKIEMNQSMLEIGANSLDVVEVVSQTMRELKVKIPRDKLGELKNVGQLVDALHAAQPK
jgi:acyl carrier protein